jgi:hypothetical protein
MQPAATQKRRRQQNTTRPATCWLLLKQEGSAASSKKEKLCATTIQPTMSANGRRSLTAFQACAMPTTNKQPIYDVDLKTVVSATTYRR